MTYNPWSDLAGRPELTFGVTNLPDGSGDAWWLPDVPGIAMNRGLTRTRRRCALAHELVHAEVGDRPCHDNGPDGPRLARRDELFADRVSAERLISLDGLADALAWALSPEEVADELDVTPHVARVRIRNLTDDEKTWIEWRIRNKEEGA